MPLCAHAPRHNSLDCGSENASPWGMHVRIWATGFSFIKISADIHVRSVSTVQYAYLVYKAFRLLTAVMNNEQTLHSKLRNLTKTQHGSWRFLVPANLRTSENRYLYPWRKKAVRVLTRSRFSFHTQCVPFEKVKLSCLMSVANRQRLPSYTGRQCEKPLIVGDRTHDLLLNIVLTYTMTKNKVRSSHTGWGKEANLIFFFWKPQNRLTWLWCWTDGRAAMLSSCGTPWRSELLAERCLSPRRIEEPQNIDTQRKPDSQLEEEKQKSFNLNGHKRCQRTRI